jgi:hypothetical protein
LHKICPLSVQNVNVSLKNVLNLVIVNAAKTAQKKPVVV